MQFSLSLLHFDKLIRNNCQYFNSKSNHLTTTVVLIVTAFNHTGIKLKDFKTKYHKENAKELVANISLASRG